MPIAVTPASVSLGVTAVVFVLMLAELRLSRRNERALRARGAVEPSGDVYRTMAWAYPVGFVAMAIEGALAGRSPGAATAVGALVFCSGKALKYWAVSSLGPRWTFRVLVVPGGTLVKTGPYALMRHPNYLGVMGELVGVALLVGAAVTGVLAAIGFGYVLRRRIAIEERALEIAPNEMRAKGNAHEKKGEKSAETNAL